MRASQNAAHEMLVDTARQGWVHSNNSVASHSRSAAAVNDDDGTARLDNCGVSGHATIQNNVPP
jgi:hypothetical protein